MNRRGVALLSASHLVDDAYQGCVPALLPFLVAERHYSYAAVSGLTLAATAFSSVAQPAFGWFSDRRPRRWLIVAGMSTAAIGIGLAGISSDYRLTWLAMALSGLGVAAFHPEAARAARQASGNSTRAMSFFALGGNLGFAAGSLLASTVLLATGVRGTPLLVLPAALMAVVLLTSLSRVLDGAAAGPRLAAEAPRADDWPAFARLTAVVVVRSVLFFGLSSFLALYFIDELGASTGEGGAALTTFLLAGAGGTLLGGWLADRAGRLSCLRWGFAMAVPSVLGLVLVSNRWLAMVFVVLTGAAVFLPFSVFIVLGQDYLPGHVGTASGVTVGLAVSAGGLASPLIGALADATTLRTALALLIALPVIALVLSSRMSDPGAPSAERSPAGSGPVKAFPAGE